MSILCYHDVHPSWDSPLAITPGAFASHCAFLRRRRDVVALGVAAARMDTRGRLPWGMVAITFDDGFADLYHHAFPTLKAAGLPATVFLVAETLTPAGRSVDWVGPWDNPPDPPPATLTLEQILEMQDAGLEFMSHSYAHRHLECMDEADCVRDLRDSRELLESLLGRPVPHLAYPYGCHTPTIRRAAALAGYTHGFTLPDDPEPSGPYRVPRMGVLPGALRTLTVKTSGWYPRLRGTAPYAAARRVVRAWREPSGTRAELAAARPAMLPGED